MNTKTVGELFQTRRDLLKLGGLGLLGASAEAVWPLKIAAAEGAAAKVQPRGNARNVLFYEISGAISHVEGFDFKDNAGAPKDLDVHKIKTICSSPSSCSPSSKSTSTSSRYCARW